jgi:hypothetical protein
VQQKVSPWKRQTSSAQESQLGSSAEPVTHRLCAQLLAQVPQSPGQVLHVSLPSQTPLPHTGGQAPQSPGQVVQVSPASQTPLPHTGGQAPQSAGQVPHVSPGSQMPLPQTTPPHDAPHTAMTSLTQALPQVDAQQEGNWAQIWVTQGSQVIWSGAPGVHLSCAHGHTPQSAGQVEQVSPAWQMPLPHTAPPLEEDALDDELDVDEEALDEADELEDEADVDDEEDEEEDDDEEVVTSSPLDEAADDAEEVTSPAPLDATVAPGPAPPAPMRTSPWAQARSAQPTVKSVTGTLRRGLTAHLQEVGDEGVPGESVSPMGSPVNTRRRPPPRRAFCGAGSGVLRAPVITSERPWQKIRGRHP